MKRLVWLTAIFSIMVLFASCASPSPVSGSESQPSAIGGVSGQNNEAKIAVIDFGGQQQTEFGQEVWAAVTRFAGENGMGCNMYTTTEKDFDPTLELAKKSGAEIVVMTGDEYGALLETAQRNHKDLAFLLLDASGQWKLQKNSVMQHFSSEEAGWLLGYVSVAGGMRSLAAVQFPSNSAEQRRYIAGFVLGAEAAAEEGGIGEGEVLIYTADLPETSDTTELEHQLAYFAGQGVQAVFLPGGSTVDGLERMAARAGVGLLLETSDSKSATVLYSTQKGPQPVLNTILADWKSGKFPAAQTISSGLSENAIQIKTGASGDDAQTEIIVQQALVSFKKDGVYTALQEQAAQAEENGHLPTAEQLQLQRVVLVEPKAEPDDSSTVSSGSQSQTSSLPALA